MIEQERPYTFDRVVRLAITAALIWGLVQLFQYLSSVLIPFGIAVLIAYLLNPLVCLVQKKVTHRSAAVLLSLFTVSLVFTGLVWFCISIIVGESVRFAQLVQKLAADQDWQQRLMDLLPVTVVEEIDTALSDEGLLTLLSTDGFWSRLTEYLSDLMPWLGNLGGGLLGLLGLSVIVLYVVFLLIDYEWFRRNWNKFIPPGKRDQVDGLLGDFNDAMNRHFRAQALVALFVGLLSALGFWIIGLPMAVLFGLFVGLLNMVPYLQLLALVPAALLACMQSLESGGSIGLSLLGVAIVFGVVQVIQDAVLVPRIMGKAFGLRPVIILLAIMIWGKILGFLGLIIALPMTCLGWAWYQRLVIRPQEEVVADQEGDGGISAPVSRPD